MNLKRILLGLSTLLIAGAALAQTTLPPFITGTDDQNKNSIVHIGISRLASNLSLTATAGGTLANSIVLNRGYNYFTVIATAGDSATLPTLDGSVFIWVTNADSTDSMNIFPNSSTATINVVGAGSAFALAAGKTVGFVQATPGKWYTIPLVP